MYCHFYFSDKYIFYLDTSQIYIKETQTMEMSAKSARILEFANCNSTEA